jgi:hypothetical protein
MLQNMRHPSQDIAQNSMPHLRNSEWLSVCNFDKHPLHPSQFLALPKGKVVIGLSSYVILILMRTEFAALTASLGSLSTTPPSKGHM